LNANRHKEIQMANAYTHDETYTIAQITAFIYAGALQHPTKGVTGEDGADFEHWEGHRGFVTYCALYAMAINEWLEEERADDQVPGSILYELMEPMGEWMIGLDSPLQTHQALEHFKTEYLAWID